MVWVSMTSRVPVAPKVAELALDPRPDVTRDRPRRLQDEIGADQASRFARQRRPDVLDDASQRDDRGHADARRTGRRSRAATRRTGSRARASAGRTSSPNLLSDGPALGEPAVAKHDDLVRSGRELRDRA